MNRTLLLDLDGTLVDSVPDIAAALNRLMHGLGLAPFGDAEAASFVGDGVAVTVRRAFAARGASPGDPRIAPAIETFSADYAAHAAEASRPFPGIPAQLHQLRAQGWALAVCTNKPENAARALLEALGLMPLLCALGAGDTFPVRKPDPGHLLGTLRLAGGTVDRAIMVGDHANDVLAARAAGVKSVFAAWGYGTRAMRDGADAVAEDVPALAGVLARLMP